MPRRSLLLMLLLTALALPLAACGGDDSSGEASTPTPAAEDTPDAATTVEQLAESVSKDVSERPQVPIPAGETPTKLVLRDIVKGSGRKAAKGDTIRVQYVGSSWSTGQEFDASWDKGQPFSFTLGKGGVIPGWDKGVPGMRVGGRRLLVIPPELGYGSQGSPPAIAPDETLAFVIDLKSID